MDENIQEVSTQEVDKTGGWLVTHFTRTWDRRERLDDVQAKLKTATSDLAAKQAEVDALTAVAAQLDTKTDPAATSTPATI